MNDRNSTEEKNREIAKSYVDRQLAAMEQGGLKTRKVSDEEYQSMVDQIAATVRT